MIRAVALLLTIALTSFVFPRNAHAQALIQIDSPSIPIDQNFDSMGNATQLPIGWVVSNESLFETGRSHVDKTAGTSGTG
ncbi:MAG TPA: hypothetical protein VGP94_14135, partial [Tepidisphaeraceae bacterium]|nr:hypothetical protein [Tepidisphaeraceae bacterium]